MDDLRMGNSDSGNLIEFPFSYVSKSIKRSSKNNLENYGQLYGSSSAMQKLYDMISRVAQTDATVLIIGESGTGKELVAQTLHQVGKRATQPFVAVNCGALPSTLIEAELFGYERGSFTGANRMHKGCFERAAGGTLFLDEITEMVPELQVKLLRVLESGVFYRVGGDQEIKVKVRVIAATNRNPEAAVAQGKLREDLLYRLAVFPLEVPPLRDRGNDIELLASHFLNLLNEEEGTNKKFSSGAIATLSSYKWPGNVRELKNMIQRSFIMANDLVELGDFRVSKKIEPLETRQDGLHFTAGLTLAEVERHLIYATLEHLSGNKRKTAEVLGLSLKTLYNRLAEYENAKLTVAG